MAMLASRCRGSRATSPASISRFVLVWDMIRSNRELNMPFRGPYLLNMRSTKVRKEARLSLLLLSPRRWSRTNCTVHKLRPAIRQENSS